MSYKEFAEFGAAISAQKWIYAKTMPQNPHHYALRDKWIGDYPFDQAVEFLRSNGYRETYQGRPYTQINVNGHFYWTMGAPIPATILINRKPLMLAADYDKIAEQYDSLFVDERDIAMNEAVMDIIGDVSRLSVLDAGCGTGLFLDYKTPAKYAGVDISAGMISVLRKKHPAAQATVTPFISFAGDAEYDLTVCLFGTADYMSEDEVRRLTETVKIGGRVVAMFFAPDYTPATHDLTGIAPAYNRHDMGLVGSVVARVGDFIVVEATRGR